MCLQPQLASVVHQNPSADALPLHTPFSKKNMVCQQLRQQALQLCCDLLLQVCIEVSPLQHCLWHQRHSSISAAAAVAEDSTPKACLESCWHNY
jgi:hypothetical protein